VIIGDDKIQPKSSDEDSAFIAAEDVRHAPKTFIIVKTEDDH
jgi:hypothetical protein